MIENENSVQNDVTSEAEITVDSGENQTTKKRGRKSSGKTKTKTPSKSAKEERIKQSLMDDLFTFLQDKYGECLKVIPFEDSTSTKNYALASPIVDEEGNTTWIKVEASVPRGTRSSKGYNGYDMAEKYKMNMVGEAEEIPLPF